MSKLNDAIFDGKSKIEDVCRSIDHLANSFDRVGNTQIADELADYTTLIRRQMELILDAHVGKINEDVVHSQVMSRGLLEAVFAGVKMGQENPGLAE